ncbi:hypothetical protein E2C01_026497 [Portunus trituberculatus]|uniref:Uncharacterized protein n=1 Tax=Portunus trituberculatus TaxID=210409 RepID=A0A5B7EL42_PORTR|nr:hypothetical protein [Portunus trituberculatus]
MPVLSWFCVEFKTGIHSVAASGKEASQHMNSSVRGCEGSRDFTQTHMARLAEFLPPRDPRRDFLTFELTALCYQNGYIEAILMVFCW